MMYSSFSPLAWSLANPTNADEKAQTLRSVILSYISLFPSFAFSHSLTPCLIKHTITSLSSVRQTQHRMDEYSEADQRDSEEGLLRLDNSFYPNSLHICLKSLAVCLHTDQVPVCQKVPSGV